MPAPTTKQLRLFNIDRFSDSDAIASNNGKWSINQFSAEGLCPEAERQSLERKFLPLTQITSDFNRQSVSYQMSKKDCLHRWLKYKEGFSADLVEQLLDEMGIKQGDTILDPFLGSGTTSLVAQMRGINSIGFDIMPMLNIAIKAKANVANYDLRELSSFLHYIISIKRPSGYNKRVNSVYVTKNAYAIETEMDIAFFTDAINDSHFSEHAKTLGILCVLNSLEHVSFTAKDGQYLRWDERSTKIIEANITRQAAGRPPFKIILNKGELPQLKDAIIEQLKQAIDDVHYLQNNSSPLLSKAKISFTQGSSLLELPRLDNNTIHGVITSPPYCNRYDYTRIYALELAYLGVGEIEIRKIRQDLLSCTVESKPKIEFLSEYYRSIGKQYDYDEIMSIINSNEVLNEVLYALTKRNERGDINNKGVLPMVKGYFEELTFIFYELFRICRKGAQVAFVNDNVRYAGEVIPVDFLSTAIAERIGFRPIKIYTLKQQKGNSSQQMAKFGRVPLRKSITIWEK
ncbi:MAG: site-specific DNA-methyltransferase [Synergistaceae bacterium]|nr:site-specific DNA-methyltransferase [Synergistaceae bacterium]